MVGFTCDADYIDDVTEDLADVNHIFFNVYGDYFNVNLVYSDVNHLKLGVELVKNGEWIRIVGYFFIFYPVLHFLCKPVLG